jgi:hypothetical protein
MYSVAAAPPAVEPEPPDMGACVTFMLNLEIAPSGMKHAPFRPVTIVMGEVCFPF